MAAEPVRCSHCRDVMPDGIGVGSDARDEGWWMASIEGDDGKVTIGITCPMDACRAKTIAANGTPFFDDSDVEDPNWGLDGEPL